MGQQTKQHIMKNILISYFFRKIKTNIVRKSKFYFYLLFNKKKLKELFMYNGPKPIVYTVEDLLNDLIAKSNLSLDTPVTYQRIEDSYFTERTWHDGSVLKPWSTYKVKGDSYYQAIHFNKQIEKGRLVKLGKLDKDDVGRYYYENDLIPIDIEKNGDDLKDQYVNAQCGYYEAENDIFCVTAHI